MISIVIPTRNREPFLLKTLDTIREQQYAGDIEVIIVIDGTEDKTKESLDKYVFGQLHYTIIESDHIGVQAARNLGREHATGEYIMFSDDDIMFDCMALYVLRRALERNPDAAYAYCNYDRIGLSDAPHIAMHFDAESLKKRNYVSMVSLIRSSDLCFTPFDESIKRLQDWDLWLTLLLKYNKEGVYVNQTLFDAWVLPNGISDDSGTTQNHREAFNIVKKKHGLC